MTLRQNGQTFEVACSFSGPQKGLNLAAAFATAKALGFTDQDILEGLKTFQGVDRRFQSFVWQGRRAIDDAYNASPESMREGLRHLALISPGQKTLLVIGSMLELGAYSEKEHRDLGAFILTTFSSPKPLLITVGDEAEALYKSVEGHLPDENRRHFSSALDARPFVETLAKKADVIYFKGSKGIQLQKIFL